jgi:integrase
MGKELSQTTASLVAALDIVDADKRTTEQANGRKVNVFSFHSLRKAYILNAVKALPETRGTLREAQRLLGHSSLSTTNDNYKDVFYLID